MIYVLQVKTGKEKEFIVQVKKGLDNKQHLFFPERVLYINRKKQKRISKCQALFAGYVFLHTEEKLDAIVKPLRALDSFVRFLPKNSLPQPLDQEEETAIRQLIGFGNIIPASLIEFNKNKPVKIISGPLKGMEGKIAKIDRRKQRVKVQLDLYNEGFLIDFAFNAVEGKNDQQK